MWSIDIIEYECIDNTTVTIQAHPFPLNSPYATTKYAKLNVRIATPVTTIIPTNNVSGIVIEPNVLVPVTGGKLLLFISTPNRTGATVTAAIPLARNAIPSITVSIASIVTPVGLRFCYCSILIYL